MSFTKKTKILDQKWHLPLWKEQHWSRGAVQLFILPKHESQCSQGEQNHLVKSSAVNTLSHFLIENFKKNCRRQVAKPWSTIVTAYQFQKYVKINCSQKGMCVHIFHLTSILATFVPRFLQTNSLLTHFTLSKYWHLPRKISRPARFIIFTKH